MGRIGLCGVCLFFFLLIPLRAGAQQENRPASSAEGAREAEEAEQADNGASSLLDIHEFYVQGNTVLDQAVIGNVLQPFMGDDRTLDEVDEARAALEKAYHEQGYRTVAVSIPRQTVKNGVVRLEVMEGEVGRLTVKNSAYYSIERIKEQAPSLSEGTVPDFDEVQEDLVGLNRQRGRSVTPNLKAGEAPGTVDVDLMVEGDPPVGGRVELNNRRSQDTSDLRALASLSYDNLWQRGHSMTLSYQVAPENRDDAEVFFMSYLAPAGRNFNVLFNALKSDSNVSTVGGTNVIGEGETFSARGIWQLPPGENSFTSVSAGLDYKNYKSRTLLGESGFEAPLEYYPVNLGITHTLVKELSTLEANLSLVFAQLEWGSGADEFDDARYRARGQQYYLRGGLSWERSLFQDMALHLSGDAQITDQPLVTYEQFSAGGMDSVRGYLESEQTGDKGVAASAELRSPAFTPTPMLSDLILYGFVEGARLWVVEALPEQQDRHSLYSAGLGLDMTLLTFINATVNWAVPLRDASETEKHDNRILFRVWSTF